MSNKTKANNIPHKNTFNHYYNSLYKQHHYIIKKHPLLYNTAYAFFFENDPLRLAEAYKNIYILGQLQIQRIYNHIKRTNEDTVNSFTNPYYYYELITKWIAILSKPHPKQSSSTLLADYIRSRELLRYLQSQNKLR